MQTTQNSNYSNFISQLDSFFQKYLVDNFPISLPENLKEFLVKIFPIFSLIFAIFLVPFIVAGLGLSALFAPLRFLFHLSQPINNIFSLAIWLLSAIRLSLWAMAIPSLFNRTQKGWTYSYYNVLLGFLSSLISGSLSSGLVSTILSLYLLYQIKNKYQNG